MRDPCLGDLLDFGIYMSIKPRVIIERFSAKEVWCKYTSPLALEGKKIYFPCKRIAW